MSEPVKLGLYGIYDPEVWRDDSYNVYIKDGDRQIEMTSDAADRLMKWLKETKYTQTRRK